MPKIQRTLILEITPEQYLNSCSPMELKELDLLLSGSLYQQRMNTKSCSVCGCTEWDCRQCIERTGEPCYWFEEDLCSACAASTINSIEYGSEN